MLTAWRWCSMVHVALGFVALVSFWLPVVLRKGGPAHRAVGAVFLAAMTGVSVTALVMAGMTLGWPATLHPDRSIGHAHLVALFLGYLAVVSLVIVHNVLAATRFKRDTAGLGAPWRRALNAVSVAASVGSLLYGLVTGAVLLVAMSPVGLAVANGYRKHLAAAEADPRAWLRAHISATLAGGIAVHTAFIAGGGTRFLPEWVTSLGVFGWVLPTLVGVPAMIVWQRRVAPEG